MAAVNFDLTVVFEVHVVFETIHVTAVDFVSGFDKNRVGAGESFEFSVFNGQAFLVAD